MKFSKILLWGSGLVLIIGIIFGLMFPEHSWVTSPKSTDSSIAVSVNRFGLITLALLALGIMARKIERKAEVGKKHIDNKKG